jgi:hypothetical protein
LDFLPARVTAYLNSERRHDAIACGLRGKE